MVQWFTRGSLPVQNRASGSGSVVHPLIGGNRSTREPPRPPARGPGGSVPGIGAPLVLASRRGQLERQTFGYASRCALALSSCFQPPACTARRVSAREFQHDAAAPMLSRSWEMAS